MKYNWYNKVIKTKNLEQQENLIWWKWTKRIFASVGLLIFLFVGVSILVVNLYEEEIKKYAIQQLNEKLDTPVSVKHIDLTLIDQFPMASLRFSDVFIADKLSKSKKDTMLSIQYLYLNLNFLDLINGKYAIKKVKAKHTVAYLKIDKKGKDNYSIFKTDTAVADSQFSFDLKKVDFKDIRIKYSNELQQQIIDVESEDLDFKGEFSAVNYKMKTKGDLFVKEFMSDSVLYLHNKNARIDLSLNVETKKNAYYIEKGVLEVEDLAFLITGDYIGNEKAPPFVNLDIKGKNISFASIFSVFPPHFMQVLKQYNTKGVLTFSATLKGDIEKEKLPKLTAKFNLEQGGLTEKENNISLNNLSFNGVFSNNNKGVNSILELNNIIGELEQGGGNFSGMIRLKDFANLQIETVLKADLNLAVIKEFVNNNAIKMLNGKALVDYSLKGKFVNRVFKIKKSVGQVVLEQVNIQTNINNLTYNNISAVALLNKNDVEIKNISLTIAESDINGRALIKNVVSSLFNANQQIGVNASVQTQRIDLGKIMSLLKSNTEEENTVDSLFLPQNITLNLSTSAKELVYKNFKIINFVGIVRLKNKHLLTKNVKFKTSGGNVLFNSDLEQTSNAHFLWTGNAKMENINIQKFFASVDNFGQTELTDKNLSGKGSLLFDFGMIFTPNFTLLQPSITVSAKTKIVDGALKNYTPLMDLATYFDETKVINKVLDTKRIKKKSSNIKFSEFTSRFYIREENIHIPKTEIKTNILDLKLSGTHSFNNDVDYHLAFRLRDVLLKNKKAEEFGPIKDDGLGKKLFIHLYGNLDTDIKYEIDKLEKKESKKRAREEEKKNVKAILKEEFGLFKKDSSLHSSSSNKNQEPTFEIEHWEESDEPEEETPEAEEIKKKKKPKRTPKWLKKLGVEEKKENQKEISVEFEEEEW